MLLYKLYERVLSNQIFTSTGGLSYWLFGLYNNVTCKTVKTLLITIVLNFAFF